MTSSIFTLEQDNIIRLKKAVDGVVKGAREKCPALWFDPRPGLEDVEDAVQQALRIGQPSRAARREDQRAQVLQFGGRMAIIAAVQSMVASERSKRHFQGAEGLNALHDAIDEVVLDFLDHLEEFWPYQGGTPTASQLNVVNTPLRRGKAQSLPREVVSNIFWRLDMPDFIRAASICDLWMDVACGRENRALWARGQMFMTEDGCRVLGAVNAFSHEPTVLPGWLIREKLLYAPSIRLVCPSRELFLRAVAALPRTEPLFVRVYDATPGSMHVAVGTATGRLREAVHVEWDFWSCFARCPRLAYRVYDVDVPGADAEDASLDELFENCFPCAETREMRIMKRRAILDGLDTQTGAHAAVLPPPAPRLPRLLWPRTNSGPVPRPSGLCVSEGDIFGEC